MIRKRVRAQRIGKRLSTKGWRNTLVDVPAFLIGNSPSLKDVDLDLLKNHFTIGINRAFYKIDPTILMWQDPELWYSEKHRIPRTSAIKYCRDKADSHSRFYHFKLANGGFKLPETAETLFGRGASGPLAFQLAWILGCNPIVILGMDCKYVAGKTNFYGKNPCHKPHTLRNCKRGLSWIANVNHGRSVYNCSCDDVFKKHYTLKETLSLIDYEKPQNRESLSRRILGTG